MHGVQIMAHLLYYVYVLYVVQNVRESLTLYDAMEGVPQNCETRPATAVAGHTTDTAVSDRGQERRGGGPHPPAVGVCLPCDRRRRPVSATCHFFGVHPAAWFRNLVTVQARPKRFPQLSQA